MDLFCNRSLYSFFSNIKYSFVIFDKRFPIVFSKKLRLTFLIKLWGVTALLPSVFYINFCFLKASKQQQQQQQQQQPFLKKALIS